MTWQRRKILKIFVEQWEKELTRQSQYPDKPLSSNAKLVFERLAWELSLLCDYIKDVYIDLGYKAGMVDFNLWLREEIHLSIARSFDIDDDIDNVYFSISRNENILVINIIDINKLIESIIEIFDDFKKSGVCEES